MSQSQKLKAFQEYHYQFSVNTGGLIPSTAQELAFYPVYRWECAVRASVVAGFVGAGGLGQLMDQSMKMLNGGEVSTILAVFFILELLADNISLLLRNKLD